MTLPAGDTPEGFAAELMGWATAVPEAAKAVVISSARNIAKDIEANAPSRNIADNVRTRPYEFPGSFGAEVHPDHPLSHLFEFGTGPRFQTRGGRYTGVMTPRPFVWPAFDREEPSFMRGLEHAMTRFL